MSWDVVLIRTKTNMEPIDDIEMENIVPFSYTELAGEVKNIGEIIAATVHCDSCLEIQKDGWDIEFCIDPHEQKDAVMMHVWGEENPETVFQYLCQHLDARALDTSKGFMDFQEPSGFEKWQAYRDKVIGRSKKQEE